VASALRSADGRGFLVGDAAHRTTAMGGIGMNTAMHAGHNLGWKLALALRGHAGDPLLDSYQAERLPVGRANAQRSLLTDAPEYDALAIDLGVRYPSGERAPHAWVRHQRLRRSTLDLFDGRLTVLAGHDGGHWRAAARALGAEGLPISGLAVGRDLNPLDGTFEERYRLGSSGAVLVRPDGYLAARLDTPTESATTALRSAVDHTLGHHPAALTHAS
jgi:hypothetical protein